VVALVLALVVRTCVVFLLSLLPFRVLLRLEARSTLSRRAVCGQACCLKYVRATKDYKFAMYEVCPSCRHWGGPAERHAFGFCNLWLRWKTGRDWCRSWKPYRYDLERKEVA